LRMLQGRAPAAREITALDAYLVTASDHGMNASTFTARVVASTGLSLYDAVIAGLAALKGPKHGGAGVLASQLVKTLVDRDVE
ncbi:citrate/2-methylcitrate synthase, partial [Bradyrhizobium sp. INPA01-394B]|uniref:citrate/2-methylcitrate synthase n=1 Tax=Bradyrhizobium campsiandrae TaxID=1729892 RepID=UPI00165FF9E5